MICRFLPVLCLTIALVQSPSFANSKKPSNLIPDTVSFPTNCSAEAESLIERGVFQMHHMMYDLARGFFQDASKADADCAYAYWGQAMTHIHPLWPDRPTTDLNDLGRGLSEKAVSVSGQDERALGFSAAASAYFSDEAGTEADRLARFKQAWKSLYEINPNDQEIKAFYALSLIATADPKDKTYAQRIVAGGMAEEVLARVPNHPGAQHYIIHAFDVPGLAERSLPVARQYGVVAPEVPHALHMMSHIFTRLGLWDESIEWNTRSAAAALKVSDTQGSLSMHYLHALDYLAYAYLQEGDDEAALEVVQTMAALQPPYGKTNRVAHAYAMAATPTRYVLERHDWSEATSLETKIPATFPWETTHAPFAALTHFARGLGLAHEGRFDEAWDEIAALDAIIESTQTWSAYWAKQVQIQKQSVHAWVLFLSGKEQEGLAAMIEAAAMEATTEKSPVTPGEVLPAAELLGDMQISLKLYDDAIHSYRAVLQRSPRRLNSLYGTGRALELKGDVDAAKAYYGEVVAMTSAESDRPYVLQARAFVSE